MAPTGYTVATAAMLLGAKPPTRHEIADVYFAQMAATDQQNREKSQLQRTAEVKRKDGPKKVRFTPSTGSIADGAGFTKAGGKKAMLEQDGDVEADCIQAHEIYSTRAGTTGVAVSSANCAGPAGGLSSNTATSSSELKPTVSVARQDAWTAGKEAAGALQPTGSSVTSSENKEARQAAQPSNFAAPPFAHPHRSNANSRAHHPIGPIRVDTSGRSHVDDDTGRRDGAAEAAWYTASASSSSSPRRTGKDEIFFTPIDINRSTIEFEFFNAPMTAPRVLGSDPSFERGESSRASSSPLLSKGKEPQHQYQHARHHSYDGRPRRRSTTARTKKDKITLSPEQLDQLIVALANAPLVQTHLRKQWLEVEEAEQRGNPSLLSLRSALRETEPSDSTPSLTNNSTASDPASNSSSGANANLNNDPHSPSTIDSEDAQAYFEHPLAHYRPRAPLGGIALTDPKVHGAPIRFLSKGYKKGANVLQVGQCSFLNVPYGASVDCVLRIEPGDTANGGAACSVSLQVLAQVLERRKRRKVYLLVAEVDVTESLTKAVLVELSRHTGMSLEDIEIVRPEPARHDSFQESVDWCALADELQATSSTNDIITDTCAAFKSLDAETCTMQTLTMLSELERIKAQHEDFLVLRATDTVHHNGMPTGIAVPWISQHLDHYVNLWSPEATSLFREDLVAAVGRRHADGEPFAVRIMWGRKKKIARCVPLLEGEEGRTASWVAFIGDEFDF